MVHALGDKEHLPRQRVRHRHALVHRLRLDDSAAVGAQQGRVQRLRELGLGQRRRRAGCPTAEANVHRRLAAVGYEVDQGVCGLLWAHAREVESARGGGVRQGERAGKKSKHGGRSGNIPRISKNRQGVCTNSGQRTGSCRATPGNADNDKQKHCKHNCPVRPGGYAVQDMHKLRKAVHFRIFTHRIQ